jgi:hypothetical protein
MLATERGSRNQIFAHRQSPDDDRVETNPSDEARRYINSVRVVAGERNPGEFALPVRVRRGLQQAFGGDISEEVREQLKALVEDCKLVLRTGTEKSD